MQNPLQTDAVLGAKARKGDGCCLQWWQVAVSVHRACARQDWKAVGAGAGDLSDGIREQQVSLETVQVSDCLIRKGPAGGKSLLRKFKNAGQHAASGGIPAL